MSAPADRVTASWTADKERSNRWALRLMRWIAITAGRRVARLVLHPITLYFLLVNGRARRASLNYLVRVLGRPVRWADAYRHIHCFASTILDRVYFLQERFAQFDMSASGAQAIHEPLDRGEGVLLVGAHLGSFEALRASAQAIEPRASAQGRGMKVAMLMFEENARLINATLAAIAPNAQLQTIALGTPGAMLQLRRWLDEGGMAGMLADRTLPPRADRAPRNDRARTLSIDFLGQPASFSDGPFRLAAMLRRKVVFMAGLYQGGKRYELRFVELADFRPQVDAGVVDAGARVHDMEARIRDAMHRYVALLETLCRESPYNWFNFFDFWATDAADRTVPD